MTAWRWVIIAIPLLIADSKMADKRAIGELISKLTNDKESSASGERLVEMGKENTYVVDALIKALEHKTRIVRYHAASVLGRIGGKAEKAIPALSKVFYEDKEEASNANSLGPNQEMAASALGGIGPPSLSVLAEALNNKDPLIRCGDLGGFSRMAFSGTSAPVPLLIEALGDQNGLVRDSAGSALIDYKKTATPQLLSAMNNDKKAVMRVEAAYVLVGIDAANQQAIDVLIEMIKDENSSVRSTACYGLSRAESNAKKAIPKLIDALKDKSGNVRQAAAGALAAMAPHAKSAVPVLIEMLDDEDGNVGDQVAFTLDEIGGLGKEHVAGLIQAAKSQFAIVRVRAFRFLGEIGPDASAAIPLLRVAIESDVPAVANCARDALEKIQR